MPPTDDGNAWNASTYDERFSFVSDYGEGVVELLDPAADERVLDVGCGTGALSRAIADAGASVVGVDSAASMVERARAQHDHPRLRFVHGDARRLGDVLSSVSVDADTDVDADEGRFDAAFSNAALHWIQGPDHDAVLQGVADSLRPGGRFVAEFGGAGNVARIVGAVAAVLAEYGYEDEDEEVATPWYFPSVGEYAPRLETHGLEVRDAHLFDRPTRLDGEDGLREWLSMFGDELLAPVPDEERSGVLDAVESRLDGQFDGDGWTVDYRRLRFRAVKPEPSV